MTDDFCDDRHASGSDFPVESLEEIQSSDDQLPSPPFIAKTMIPELLSFQRGDTVGGVSDEAPSGVGIKRQHKRDKKVMRIPESFICLLANAVMCGCVHEHHAQEHDMASDTTRASKMDLYCKFWTDLLSFDVVETG